MAEVHFQAEIGNADFAAAEKFIAKRARRRDDPLAGMAAALYSVMFIISDVLVECGMPQKEVERLFDQTRDQVISASKSADFSGRLDA